MEGTSLTMYHSWRSLAVQYLDGYLGIQIGTTVVSISTHGVQIDHDAALGGR